MNKQWVISDVHGCYLTLRKLIEEQIKPDKNDQIYLLGDYIDRGPKSKEVIDYLMDLSNSGYNVIPLIGNHELKMIEAYDAELTKKKSLFFKTKNRKLLEWISMGGQDTLNSFGVAEIKDIHESYIMWMRGLQTHVQLPGYVIVHAGLNFSNEDPFEDTHAMMWTRDFDIIPEKINNRKIVHGHVPVGIDFIKETLTSSRYNFIDIDNGCVYVNREGMGSLLAYELGSKQLLSERNIDIVATV